MNRMKRFLAVFMATLMILGTAPVYALSKTGVAAKAEYLKTEKRAFSELKESFKKSELGKLFEFAEGITGTYSSEVDLEIEIPEIKTRKYVIKENGTYIDRYDDGVIEAYVEGEKVASLDMVANDNLVSVRVPELYDKYITVDMSDLANLVNKFVEDEETRNELISTLPKGMIYNCDILEATKFTKDEEKILKNAVKKYSKLFDEELLKNTYFEKGNKQNLIVNNKTYKCDVVSYEISIDQLVAGIEKIWEEFKNDTELVNLIWRKVETLYNKMYEMNLVTEKLPTKEQVLGIVDYLLDELKEEIGEGLVLKSTLHHQNGKLLRRDISMKSYQNTLGDNEMTLVSIYTVRDGKNEYYAFYADDNKIEDFVSVNSKETIHNIVVTSKEFEYDFSDDYLTSERREVEVVEKATVKVTKVNNNQYNVEFSAENSDVKVNMEYIKNKVTSKEYDISMSFDIFTNAQNFGINTRLAYEKDIKLNKINTKGNEINLNEKSKEELVTLFEENKDEIMEKAQGKFLSAFYYEEFIEPLVNSIMKIMNQSSQIMPDDEIIEPIYEQSL